MIKYLAIAALASTALYVQSAQAANAIDISTVDMVANTALLLIDGNDNRLQITQDSSSFASGNTLTLRIEGDLNGGPLDANFTGAALNPGLEPGSIIQNGRDNSIAMEVLGSNNLFAVAQNGNGNVVTASITGSANQASVFQVGNGNIAGFSQNGIGNIVSIIQKSW